MDISDLPYPNLSQFEQYGIGKRASRVYIGREFLKFRYCDDPADDATVTKQNYVDAFFELVAEIETPFQQLHITQSTLAEVTIWLQRNQPDDAAEKCLTEALGDSPIIVNPITDAVFETAVNSFVDDVDKVPNFGEYLDHATMRDAGIEYILTWDSDFCRFNDTVTMLPHSMWNM